MRAVGCMGRALLAAGAVEVLTGIAGRPRVTSPEQLDDALADAAVLPGCAEVNPQVTIMAVALVLARAIATRLGAGPDRPKTEPRATPTTTTRTTEMREAAR